MDEELALVVYEGKEETGAPVDEGRKQQSAPSSRKDRLSENFQFLKYISHAASGLLSSIKLTIHRSYLNSRASAEWLNLIDNEGEDGLKQLYRLYGEFRYRDSRLLKDLVGTAIKLGKPQGLELLFRNSNQPPEQAIGPLGGCMKLSMHRGSVVFLEEFLKIRELFGERYISWEAQAEQDLEMLEYVVVISNKESLELRRQRKDPANERVKERYLSMTKVLLRSLFRHNRNDFQKAFKQLEKIPILHYFMDLSFTDAINDLLTFNIPVTQKDDKKNTLLHLINATSSDELVEKLVLRGAEYDKVNKLGFTPLWQAVWSNNIPVARFLVGHKADTNHFRGKEECTPLFVAAYQGSLDMIKTLVEFGKAKCNRELRTLEFEPWEIALLRQDDEEKEEIIGYLAKMGKKTEEDKEKARHGMRCLQECDPTKFEDLRNRILDALDLRGNIDYRFKILQ